MPSLETQPGPRAAHTKTKHRYRHLQRQTLWLILLIVAGGLLAVGWEWRRFETIQQRDRLELRLMQHGAHSCDRFRLEGKDWVWATARGDAGLEALTALSDLQILELTDSRVTDAGIKHLPAFRRLERLRLDGTDVTDAGLKYLQRMPQLRYVSLFATQVTERGVAELKTALPEAEILW